MTKSEWSKELRDRLKELNGVDPVVATASDLMRVMGYKDMKHFKSVYLNNITFVAGKRYSVKDFIDDNYGVTLF
jgi:hypothetical protein